MKKRWKLSILGVVAASAAGAVIYQRVAPETVRVSSGEVEQRVVARAEVVPVDGVAEVRARIDGTVLAVHVREGDHVTQGQPLAEIQADTVGDELARREAEGRSLAATARSVAAGTRPEERAALRAEVRAARHEHDLASGRNARDKQLHASGALTQEQLDESARAEEIARARLDAIQARLELAVHGARADDVHAARARVTAAEAVIAEARHELDWTHLRAPIEGVVLARNIDPGDVITNARMGGTIVFEIADVSHTELHAEVEEIDAARIRVGLPVTITWPGGLGDLGKGKLTRLGARLQRRAIGAADARERGEGWVRSAWIAPSWSAGAAGGLPVGQRVEVRLVLPPRRVDSRVPRRAIIVRDGRPAVRVASGLLWHDEPVQLGVADDRFVEIRGVAPGVAIRVVR